MYKKILLDGFVVWCRGVVRWVRVCVSAVIFAPAVVPPVVLAAVVAANVVGEAEMPDPLQLLK